MLVTGKSCVYTVGVSGTLPLSYQWYAGATPLAGQTNATYPLTAGGVASVSTYSVVITKVSMARSPAQCQP